MISQDSSYPYLQRAGASIYAIVVTALFIVIQTAAIITPAWVTYQTAEYYLNELNAYFNPPERPTDLPPGIPWPLHREQPTHMLYITIITGGSAATVFILYKSITAFLILGLGYRIPGYEVQLHQGLGTLASKLNKNILEVVEDVSSSVGVENFRKVYITRRPEISTFYTIGGRYLVISIFVLRYLTVNELKAVIAHECGHHHNGAMLLSRVHYRANMLFDGLLSVYGYTHIIARKIAGTEDLSAPIGSSFPKTFRYNIGVIVALLGLPLILWLLVYRLFLQEADHLLNDPSYELYCDSVAIDYVGGAVFSSALQKASDIYLAATAASNDRNSGESYVEDLNREYENLRIFDPEVRRRAARGESGTHPPLFLRLKRAENSSRPSEDFSKPILQTEIELIEYWKLISDSEKQFGNTWSPVGRRHVVA